MNAYFIDFPVFGDSRGKLVALEKNKDFPFEIKRCYYIWGTEKDAVRGKHAHYELEQVILCTSGSCDFHLNDGKEKKIFRLDSPSRGLYIGGNIWREFTNFSPDCVVTVLASEHYNPNDYIKDFDKFMEMANSTDTTRVRVYNECRNGAKK
jgi:dTDP-4-dehydrorhamnose 3,5-epimerase-like enzyme